MSSAPGFLVTKEYRRFVEFCDACRRYNYIGLCYGHPGVGKTLSARHYAQWDLLEPLLDQRLVEAPPPEVANSTVLLYTPRVGETAAVIYRDIDGMRGRHHWIVEDAQYVEQGLESPPRLRGSRPFKADLSSLTRQTG